MDTSIQHKLLTSHYAVEGWGISLMGYARAGTLATISSLLCTAVSVTITSTRLNTSKVDAANELS